MLVSWLAEALARGVWATVDSPGLVFLAAMVAKGLMVASVGIAVASVLRRNPSNIGQLQSRRRD